MLIPVKNQDQYGSGRTSSTADALEGLLAVSNELARAAVTLGQECAVREVQEKTSDVPVGLTPNCAGDETRSISESISEVSSRRQVMLSVANQSSTMRP